jgi:hypothetical protein
MCPSIPVRRSYTIYLVQISAWCVVREVRKQDREGTRLCIRGFPTMHSLSFPKNAAPYQECEKATNSSLIHLKTVKCGHHCPVYFAFKFLINDGGETYWRHGEFSSAIHMFHSRNEATVSRTNSAGKSSPWETNSGSAAQEISHILLNPKVHYRVHRARHWTLSWARWFLSTITHSIGNKEEPI